ncbi:MAG: hypothetical protein MUE56_04050 [Ignavibacteria bacterium]|jgi:Zn-finger domain-containing protein|nr:hypothetical protein [Ignavibacteria bacterium]
MNSNIAKVLFNEFSNLVNLDIEKQIRKNEKSLRNFDNDYYEILGNEYMNNIENMMVRFYSSISNMINVHNEKNETINNTNDINKYEKIRETFEKIMLTYKSAENYQD